MHTFTALHNTVQDSLLQRRNTPHFTTQVTPSSLLIKIHVRTKLPNLIPVVCDYVS